ncbi:YbhB/YbcL family Raf kinase inhibitor-like protein [Thermosulfuriphilus sp.]
MRWICFLTVAIFTLGFWPAHGGEAMKISSEAFGDGGRIPTKYVMIPAGGENLSPPLSWEGAPPGTKSFALSCVDPHPIARNWVHWLVINIPASVHHLPEGASGRAMPPEAKELKNSFGFVGYGGPQPPPGTGDHPYVFTIYALSTEDLDLPEDINLEGFLGAIEPYVLDKTSLTGYYSQ